MSQIPKLNLIAQMYQAREKMKYGLGKDYAAKLRPIIVELKRVMAAKECNEIQAALMLVNALNDEKDPMRKKIMTGMIFSGALDIDDELAQKALHDHQPS